jgi:L-alanine-DL-glutamate epimerase-like enolase superfamily enzyme
MGNVRDSRSMKIVRVDVFGYDLHYRHGSYAMSGGRTVAELPSTIIHLTTDDGLEGWGEVCPLGATYLSSHAEGARAALRELAPAVLGANPLEIASVRLKMDQALRGHDYAKSPIDIACWDLLGKATGCSVTTLLGGRLQTSFPLYEAVPLGSREEMASFVLARREEGIHQFQLKVGADPYADAARIRHIVEVSGDDDRIIADANGGWRLQDAMVVARLISSLPRLYFEQPCATMA